MRKRRDEAIELYRDALERCRLCHPGATELCLNVTSGLAKALVDADQLAEAEPLTREALQGHRALHGDQHASTLMAAHNLGHLLLQKRELDEAKKTLEDVVARRASLLGLGHLRTSNSVLLLAEVLAALDEGAAAQSRITSLLADLPSGQPDGPIRIRAHTQLGVIHQRAGRFAEAETAFLEARSLAGASGPWAAENRRLLQSLYREWQDADPASNAGAKLTEMNGNLQSPPVDRGSTVRPTREGED